MFFGSGWLQPKGYNPAFTKVFAAVNKSDLRTSILNQLRQELDRSSGAAALARDEAISEESRAENKWDTHSQEAAYLAEGQARQVIEVGKSIELYQSMVLPNSSSGAPIAIGAVVGLAGRAGNTWYFVGPRAGGVEVEVEGRRILVITPQSPLGRELVGKRLGESVRAPGPASQPPLTITAVE